MSSWKKAFKDTVTLKEFQSLAKAIYYPVLIALGYVLGLYQSLKRNLSRLLKKAKKQWRSKRSVRLSALFLSLAILSLSVHMNKDKIVDWGLFLKSSLNNKLEQSWVPKIHDLLTSVVLRNNADENSLSVVAVYVLQSNQSSFEDLKNSSYEKSLIPTGKSFAFIGSGSFVRQSLFNKKSNLVLSAAHVCIVGAGVRNIAKYKEKKEGFVSTEETQGLFLGLKTKDGSTYRVKKMYLDVKSDICKMETKEVSNNSIPLRMSKESLEINQDLRISAVLNRLGFVSANSLFVGEAIIELPMPVLCDVADSASFFGELMGCGFMPDSCTDRVSSFLQESKEAQQRILFNLYMCSNTGLQQEVVSVSTMRLNGIVHLGYSGGPVLNSKGQIVGVVSAKSTEYVDATLVAYPTKVLQNDRDGTWDYVLDGSW